MRERIEDLLSSINSWELASQRTDGGLSETFSRGKNGIVKQRFRACMCMSLCENAQARHLRGDTISRRGRVGHGRVNYGGILSSLLRIQLTTF